MRFSRARLIGAGGISVWAACFGAAVVASQAAGTPVQRESQQQAQESGTPSAKRAVAQAKYDSLFGAEEKTATARGTAQAALAFATKLMESATKLSDDPDLKVILLSHAETFGAKDPAGYRVAGQALDELQKADPANAPAYRARSIDLLRQEIRRGTTNEERISAARTLFGLECDDAEGLFAAHRYAEALERQRDAIALAGRFRLPVGESVRHRLDLFGARRDAAIMLAGLEKRLVAGPGDRQLQRQTLTTAILLLDDPAAIVGIASGFPDGNTANLIRTAAKPDAELIDADCKALGAWYEQLAKETTGPAHVNAYLLAIRSYNRYLAIHAHEDAERLTVVETLLNLEKQAAAGNKGIHTADRIVVWNQHNGYFNDRGTIAFDLSLSSHGHLVFEKKKLPLAWQPGRDSSLTIPLPPLIFDTIRIDIVAYRDRGGGLAEVEAFRGEEDVALHAAARASGSFSEDNQGPDKLVDGITSSATYNVGYWALPGGTNGWAEIRLREPVPQP